MSQLAYKAFTAAQFEDVAYFEPFYLKDFVLTTPKKKI
jgi:tRNA threonylcarbamoyladenosine biosynthesis protein TsaB